MNRIFSGSVDFARVNPWGIALMAIGALTAILAGRIARRIGSKNGFKVIGLLLCAGGAMLAILGR